MNLKKLFHFALVPIPSFVKVLCYRYLFKYEIGPGVKIGFTVIMADKCVIGARSRVGHFNYIANMKRFELGSDVVIGHFNIILGGDCASLGDGALIGRFNEINSIINPLTSNPADPRLTVGRRAVITAWHKIDYTDHVIVGESAILAGRGSCIWTHNRQQTKPVEIGRNCYVGSGIQMAPGAVVPAYCVVGLGSVITKVLSAEYSLIAGVPARVVKPLDAESRAMVEFPTRPDLDSGSVLDWKSI